MYIYEFITLLVCPSEGELGTSFEFKDPSPSGGNGKIHALGRSICQVVQFGVLSTMRKIHTDTTSKHA